MLRREGLPVASAHGSCIGVSYIRNPASTYLWHVQARPTSASCPKPLSREAPNPEFSNPQKLLSVNLQCPFTAFSLCKQPTALPVRFSASKMSQQGCPRKPSSPSVSEHPSNSSGFLPAFSESPRCADDPINPLSCEPETMFRAMW